LQHGYFRGLLVLYLRENEIDKAIDLIVATDNYEALQTLVQTNLTVTHWNQLITSFLNNTQRSKISKEHIIKLMLSHIGPIKTLGLLIKTPEFCENLPLEIYNDFITHTQIQVQQETLIHNILETVATYLYSPKSSYIPAQIRAVKELESKRIQELKLLPFITTDSKEQLDIGFDYNTHLPRFFEEPTGHWGVQIEANRACECCGLPLLEGVMTGSLLVFPCGHAFHQFCIPERACVLCLERNMKTLISSPNHQLSN